MSTTTTNASSASDTTARRIWSLLGHAVQLETATVARRRQVADGLPMTQASQATYGAVADILQDDFSINVSDLVLSELVAALNVVSVECDDEELRALIWDAWQRSELGSGTEGLFYAAACDGQAFLVVNADPQTGDPTAYVHTAYDGETGVEVIEVADDGALTLAVKHHSETLVRDRQQTLWTRFVEWFLSRLGRPQETQAFETAERKWRTLYQLDRDTGTTYIRTYVTDPGQSERQVMQDVSGKWVNAEPDYVDTWEFGYPIVPFVAPGGGELSELDSPQRLVNAAALDLAAAGRVDALRLFYTVDCAPMGGGSSGTSLDDPINLTPGAVIELRSREGDGVAPQVGAIEGSQLLAQQENLKLLVDIFLMLGRTSTFVTPWKAQGGFPSGAALRLANSPFADKVERYQERWSAACSALFELWQGMLGREPVEVRPVWRKMSYTTRLEDLTDAQAADDLGLPESYIGAEILGLPPDVSREWVDSTTRIATDRAQQTAAIAGVGGQPVVPGQALPAAVLNGQEAGVAPAPVGGGD